MRGPVNNLWRWKARYLVIYPRCVKICFMFFIFYYMVVSFKIIRPQNKIANWHSRMKQWKESRFVYRKHNFWREKLKWVQKKFCGDAYKGNEYIFALWFVDVVKARFAMSETARGVLLKDLMIYTRNFPSWCILELDLQHAPRIRAEIYVCSSFLRIAYQARPFRAYFPAVHSWFNPRRYNLLSAMFYLAAVPPDVGCAHGDDSRNWTECKCVKKNFARKDK